VKAVLQSYEGYLEHGQIRPMIPLEKISERRRVIITVLEEPESEPESKAPDTWAELDSVISEMEELPRFEDFPRCQFRQEQNVFKEV
jgi:hypothetical protein